MKKILLSILSICLVSLNTSFSQLDKNNVLVGTSFGGGDIGLSSSSFNIRVSPKIGYFVSKGLALGIRNPMQFSRAVSGYTSFTSQEIGIGMFGRYYFIKNKPFSIIADLSYDLWINHNSVTYDYGGGSTNTQTRQVIGFGTGFVYFISENIGLEATISSAKFINFPLQGLSLRIGLHIYL